MACLELRKGSRWWYGRWCANNQVFVKNLDIPIAGARPPSISQEGDRRFEQSRAKAQAKLDELVSRSRERRRSEELVQTLHEIREDSIITFYPNTLDQPPRILIPE